MKAPTNNTAKLFDRVPPHAPHSEAMLLGSLILDPTKVLDVHEVITTASFYVERHATIYAAIIDAHANNPAFDPVVIVERLAAKGVLEQCGGQDYIAEIMECAMSGEVAPYHARIVAERYAVRQTIDALSTSLHKAYHYGDSSDVATLLGDIESSVLSVTQLNVKTEATPLCELLEEAIREQESGEIPESHTTGLYDLDAKTGGLRPGELVLVAARPSMGKTAFATTMLMGMSNKGLVCGMVSLEMSRKAITNRLISQASGVPVQAIMTMDYKGIDRGFDRVIAAAKAVMAATAVIDDHGDTSLASISARVRRLVAKHRARVVFIDYLQLMSNPSVKENRQTEVASISRGLKRLARDMNVALVVLSQLNRANEAREDHKPRMSDLRESGSLENDADGILMLHREEYYHVGDKGWADENPTKVGIAEIIVAKQRNGPTGVVTLRWNAQTATFENYQAGYQPNNDKPYTEDFRGGGK